MGERIDCCCFTPRTGCLIIGYISAVLCGIGAGYFILGALAMELTRTEEAAPQDKVLFRIFLMAGVVFLKALAINCLFLVGVHKDRRSFILPWIIVSCAALVFQFMFGIQLAVMLGSYGTLGHWVGAAFGTLFQFAFHVYLLMVVISYYHNMRKRSLLDEEQVMM